ncbi:hypothetical protein B5F76_08305 [Desulfovibrio sp. An276]|uniref:hypothetical protein n=1 Tax=Desulfovibrio sp. An276 TaxID=1965618 RepID=UPI000B3A0A32|nr:hypothetical protein [Desulfovibrio sp. An276]OUO52005.1 hypothetical protein B5F76_08305 [Desulfovibrio sp. An276]
MKKIRVIVTITTIIDDSVYSDTGDYLYENAEHLEDTVIDACTQAGWRAVTYGNTRDAKEEKGI